MQDLKKVLEDLNDDNKLPRGLNSLCNLALSAGIGVSPQTMTEVVCAADDFFGADSREARDYVLLTMGILNCPQSQIDMIYLDQLDLTAREARKLSARQLAERYARRKSIRTYGPILALMTPEQRREAEGKLITRFQGDAKDWLKAYTGKLGEDYDETEAQLKEARKKLDELRGRASYDEEAVRELDMFMATPGGERTNRIVAQMYKSGEGSPALHSVTTFVEDQKKAWLNEPDPEKAAQALDNYILAQKLYKDLVEAVTNDNQDRVATIIEQLISLDALLSAQQKRLKAAGLPYK